MARNDDMARSFGAASADYQAGRPGYPLEAVAWMLEPVPSPRVADVGAGTGKLTAAVIAAGAQSVIAVEPDEEMLAQLREVLPGVETLVGTGESLPLPDESLDAVVLGQAWHWVDPVKGSREIARVLRPGGVLGLIWNIRDESVPWVSRMSEIMHMSNAEAALADGGPDIAAPFGELEVKRWTWIQSRSRAELFAMVRSRSYVITASPEKRAEIEQSLSELFDEIGAVEDARIDLPYVTSAFRARRP